MRISGSGRASAPSSKASSRSSGASGGKFSIGDTGSAARAAATTAASALTAIDSILALQAVEDPLEGKKKAVRRGSTLLDLLEDIKIDLLAGEVSEHRLGQVMKILAQKRDHTDERLDALLDDIELRARVELAKRGRFQA